MISTFFKKELLTTENIAKGQWILDERFHLCQIIQVDESKMPRYPSEITFTYRIFGGHNCWTSVRKNGKPYPKFIVKGVWVIFYKLFFHFKSFHENFNTRIN